MDFKRHPTPAEQEWLAQLRTRLWHAFEDDEKTQPLQGQKLSLDDWDRLRKLIQDRVLFVEIASGLTTPNPFVLCFDSTDNPAVFMIHPSQIPKEMEDTPDIAQLFKNIASTL